MSEFAITIRSIVAALKLCGFHVAGYIFYPPSGPVFCTVVARYTAGDIFPDTETFDPPAESFEVPISVSALSAIEIEREFLRHYAANWKKYNLPCITFDTKTLE